MYKKLFFKKGFTLIELLVVISIIALLASVVLTSLNSARSKGRDTKRISDLRQVANALELYRSANSDYPVDGANTRVSEIVGLDPTYIPALPNDPTQTGSSNYRYCAGVNNYVLLARLERTGTWCYVTGAPGTACSWMSSYSQCR
ncbi:type II secretion system GspH family protein [Patescibacteria group bacterium]|nr:type II secretion system GspH family protein [Patescibacteria group bacterium]